MAKTTEYPEINDPTGAMLLATTSGGAVGNIATGKFARSDAALQSVQQGAGIIIDTADPLNPAISLDSDSVFDKENDTLDDIGDGTTYKRMTADEQAKINHLTVTQPVNLDSIETKLDNIEANADVTDADNVRAVFSAEKATIHDNDRIAGMDSEAANAPKYWGFSTLKNALKAVFDALYVPAFADPGTDRIVFWDDSTGQFAPLTVGANLSISGTTLNASGGGGGGGGDMDSAIYDPNGVASDAFDMDNMVEGTNTKIMTATERTKLSGVASGATANDSDANLKNRANHTGSQPSSTISDFSSAADARIATAVGVSVQAYDADLSTIAALSKADGNFIVGDGTDWTVESGATARSSLGLGTDNSPQFTAINLGHASDTTLTRVSAGVAAIEGNNVLLATDLGVSVQAYDAGNAPVKGKQAIFIPASGFLPRVTNGAAAFSSELATNDVMIRGYDFDTSTVEAIQALVALPKQWNEGTVTFRAYWTAASGSGGVAFSLKGRAASDDDAMDGTWGTGVAVTDTFITANDLHVTAESSAITIGGTPAEGDMIWIEVAREVANGSDTLAVDARLLGIEFFITTNAGTDA